MNNEEFVRKCENTGRKCEHEVHKSLGLFSKKYREWIYDYKGYMFKEDGLLDYHEWHPTFYSIVLIGLAYTFPAPLNLVFLGLWIQILRRVNQDSKAENELMKQVNKNPWYFLGHGAVLIFFFEYQGMSLGLAEMETEVIFEALKLIVGG